MKPIIYDLINKTWAPLLSIFLLLTCQDLNAAGEIYPVGAKAAGMGRCSVAIKGFWGIQNNQAAMALINKTSFGINYESRFMISQTSYKNAAAIIPTKFGVLGLSLNHYGYSAYNEMKIGLAYARNFGKILRIGLQLDYFSTRIGENYGSKNNISFELGIQSDLNEHLSLGAYVFNPVQVKLSDYNQETLAGVLRFGLAYTFDVPLIISAEIEKSTFINPLLFRIGMEYSIKSKFFLRTGIASRYEIFTLGFGMYFKHLKLDIAATMHESLGFSPQMGFIFKL